MAATRNKTAPVKAKAAPTKSKAAPTKAKVASTKAKPAPSQPLSHRLDALLHTIRCIAQHEDELCTLLHEARIKGRITASLRKDLQVVLEKLPADEYTFDLQALEDELTTAA